MIVVRIVSLSFSLDLRIVWAVLNVVGDVIRVVGGDVGTIK